MSISVQHFLLFLFLMAGGVTVELLLQKLYYYITRKKFVPLQFSFGRFLYYLSVPLSGVIILYFLEGIQIVESFFIFSLVGTFIEWLIGYFYEKIIGKPLWTYHIFSLQGHTSLLAMPLWGLAGVLFWLLAKIFAV